MFLLVQQDAEYFHSMKIFLHKTTFTLLRSEIMPVEFTCVYTTPLYFINLFTSTNVNQNHFELSKEIETKSIQI